MPDSVIEHAVMAEGADLAADHKHRRKLPNCANCGFSFAAEPEKPDNFCPRCGQENHELNVSFKHLVLEFLEGTLHFDSKFFRSLQYLLVKPGFLTHEFNIGHRAGYVPPIRLYVFTSFLFFLLLSWQISKDGTKVTSINAPRTAQSVTTAPADTVRKEKFRLTFQAQTEAPVRISFPDSLANLIRNYNDAQTDSFLLANGLEPGFITRVALKQSARITKGENEKFLNKIIKNTSMLMFLFMPLFGLLLGLAYRKRKRHYVEFLMFSLHFHTFLFVLFGLYLLLPDSINSTVLDIVMLGIPLLYLALALRRVYPESWGKASLKAILLTTVYGAVLSVLLLVNILISFALF